MSKKKNVLIAVAWPYVNGDLHIGHLAGYLLPADIEARFQRLQGNNVLMVSGSDCHGTPITVQADKESKTPNEIADYYHKRDVDLFLNTLKLSYDLYTRTDTPHHAKITQDVFIALLKAGYVFIDKDKQYYSDEENRFLPDRYIEGTCPHCGFEGARSDQCDNCGKLLDQGTLINPVSKTTSSKVYLKETRHYYVDWAKLQPKIEEYVKQASPNWKKWIAQETKGWLEEGLKPRPITRDIDWGVTIPKDRIPKDLLIENVDSKRFYVWFDAVIGYLSASMLWGEQNNKDWQKFWYEENASGNELKHYYFMGKDNLVFHTMFWPAKLIVYDKKLHLPDVQAINMYLNFAGKQFSKSRGVVIDSKKIVEKFGNDMVRFYLTYIMPEKRDSSFTWEDFGQRVNNILIGNLSNFIHRSLSIAKKSDIKTIADFPLDEEVEQAIETAMSQSRNYLEAPEFKNYLQSILQLSAFGNKYFDEKQIWVLKKNDTNAFHKELKQLYAIIIALGILMQPLLFEGSQQLFQLLGIEVPDKWPEQEEFITTIESLIKNIDTSTKPVPLYKKLSEEDLTLE